MGWEATKLLCLKIAKHNTSSALHLLNRDKLLQARCNLSDLTISNINFLTVKLLTFRVDPALYNFANTDVHLVDIGHYGSCRCLWLLLLLLLLFLWRLFALFALACSGTSIRTLGLLRFLLLVLVATVIGVGFGASCCLLGLCFLGCLGLSHFLELTLGWTATLSLSVWEGGEKTLSLGLFKHSW